MKILNKKRKQQKRIALELERISNNLVFLNLIKR